MIKNPVSLLIFITFFSTIYSQGINLFNPSGNIYQFSAYDEGANGFRYNPAVLGLKHRLNATINGFFQNTYDNPQINEFGLAVNSGILGLSYRFAKPWTKDRNYFGFPDETSEQHTFSLGIGFGNKAISGGMLFELLNSSFYSTARNIIEDKSIYKFGLGILFRPVNFISASFVVKSSEAYEVNDQLTGKYILGAVFRPFFTNKVTLLSEFSLLPHNDLTVSKYAYKFGIEGKPYKGISLRAVYERINYPYSYTDIFNVGLSFDLPHFSVSYNNPFIRTENSSGKNIYISQGNGISLSFNSEKKESIVPERKKILEITLSGSLQDFHTDDVFFGLLGKGKRSVHEVIADIDYAAEDPSVKGMLLKIYPVSSGRFEINGAVEELTAALERFKKKGKHITAFLPQDTGPGEYYISTFADDIVIPQDALFFYGLSIEVFNYKQFLEKYGIELQNFYAGDYKLVFQGILDSTTSEGREVIERILDVVYDKMMSRVVTARNLILDDYLKDKLSKPLTGKEAERLGLVDKNGWYEDAKDIAEKESKTENIARFFNRNEWDETWGEPEQIAIIGVYGTIKPGESEAPSAIVLPIPYVGGGRSTGSETVVRQLEDAFSNPKVKAVILRVNSGGGSALASAEINDAIIRFKEKYKKPFIVSMGDAAASGGYLVSTSADKIFSDDLTITGSIGVWASRPSLDSLMKEQKIKIEIFKKGENSDIGSFFRKLDEEDVEIIQGIVDFYYDRFIEAISTGRKISKDDAEKIAKGRVWLGTDAFNKKLIDEIGGLYQALIYAKKKAKIDKRFKLVYYAVPGGGTLNELVSKSIVEYLQSNLKSMLGFDEEMQNIEIKY